MTIGKSRKVENYSDIWKTNFKVKTTCKLSRNIGNLQFGKVTKTSTRCIPAAMQFN